MSAMAATHSFGSSTTPSVTTRAAQLARVRELVHRRATKIDISMPVDELVDRTVERYLDSFGGGAGPVDLDGWLRRAMREILAVDRRSRARSTSHEHAQLSEILQGIAAPVRSPALAKQRKLLLHRVSELIGGPECRVLFAMINNRSSSRVAQQLGASTVDVARLHHHALQQLQTWLEHDPELASQLRDASKQPSKARTSH